MIKFSYVKNNHPGFEFKEINLEESEIGKVEIFNTRSFKRNGDFKKWFKKIRVTTTEDSIPLATYTGSYSSYAWTDFKSLVKNWQVTKTYDAERKGLSDKTCVNWTYERI